MCTTRFCRIRWYRCPEMNILHPFWTCSCFYWLSQSLSWNLKVNLNASSPEKKFSDPLMWLCCMPLLHCRHFSPRSFTGIPSFLLKLLGWSPHLCSLSLHPVLDSSYLAQFWSSQFLLKTSNSSLLITEEGLKSLAWPLKVPADQILTCFHYFLIPSLLPFFPSCVPSFIFLVPAVALPHFILLSADENSRHL